MRDFSLSKWHDTSSYTAKTAITHTLKEAGYEPQFICGHNNIINVIVRYQSYQIQISEDTTRIEVFIDIDAHFDLKSVYGYMCVNELNKRFFYAKFWLDNDSSLIAKVDIPATTLSSGYITTRAIMALDSGMDEIYDLIQYYVQKANES